MMKKNRSSEEDVRKLKYGKQKCSDHIYIKVEMSAPLIFLF